MYLCEPAALFLLNDTGFHIMWLFKRKATVQHLIQTFQRSSGSAVAKTFRVNYKRHVLTMDDLGTLYGQNWLNDQVQHYCTLHNTAVAIFKGVGSETTGCFVAFRKEAVMCCPCWVKTTRLPNSLLKYFTSTNVCIYGVSFHLWYECLCFSIWFLWIHLMGYMMCFL